MTPAAAARQWLQAHNDMKDAERRLKPAADVLKAHFKAKNLSVYRGVSYACSTITRLDSSKARALLGKRAVEAEVTQTRETLSPAPEEKAA